MICIYVSALLCVLFYRYIHIHKYMYTIYYHIYVYIYIHTHIYTYTHSGFLCLLVCECFVLSENWKRMVKWSNNFLSSNLSQGSESITFLGFVQNQLIYCEFEGAGENKCTLSRVRIAREVLVHPKLKDVLHWRTHSSKVAIWPLPTKRWENCKSHLVC